MECKDSNTKKKESISYKTCIYIYISIYVYKEVGTQAPNLLFRCCWHLLMLSLEFMSLFSTWVRPKCLIKPETVGWLYRPTLSLGLDGHESFTSNSFVRSRTSAELIVRYYDVLDAEAFLVLYNRELTVFEFTL